MVPLMPAMVDWVLVAVVYLITTFWDWTGTYTLPDTSTANLNGALTNSSVLMMPFLFTHRILLLYVSAMYRLPLTSTATPEGLLR
jgi:hypothetical protein